MTCCPTCQNANLADASSEFDEEGEGEVQGLKCFQCGWRGKIEPSITKENSMGKWSEEAKAALKARRSAARTVEPHTAVATMTPRVLSPRPVSHDGNVLAILDAAIGKLRDEQTVLMRAREIMEQRSA